jgi:hypothetical protein
MTLNDWTSRKLWVTLAAMALLAVIAASMAYVAVKSPEQFDAYKAAVILVASIVAGIVAHNYVSVQGAVDKASLPGANGATATETIDLFVRLAAIIQKAITEDAPPERACAPPAAASPAPTETK